MKVIEFDAVSKRFRRTLTGTGPRRPGRVNPSAAFPWSGEDSWALRDVSLDVHRGESFALVGANGSGKSTALRIMAGVTAATKGDVVVRGAVGGLLTLGDGLHPLLSGEENIITGGILSGLPRREVLRRLPEIAAFAELEDHLDQPLRTYSDGMRVRLAFSTAIHVDPEILMVDEILAVGDLRFQEKCLTRLEAMRDGGMTVVFVSHIVPTVARLAQRAAWLEGGRLRMIGDVDTVVDHYQHRMQDQVPAPTTYGSDGLRLGSGEVRISAVALIGPDSVPVSVIRSGAPLAVELDFEVNEVVTDPIVNVSVRSASDGVMPIDLSTEHDGLRTGVVAFAGRIRLELDRVDLAEGIYYLDVGIFERSWARPLDYLWQALSFEVVANPSTGALAPPRRWVMT